jgi:MtN3 and saliva related transmembrane protein
MGSVFWNEQASGESCDILAQPPFSCRSPLADTPMISPDFVGYGAAVLTTAAFVPQAVKSWSTRDLSGISLSMYSLFTLGVGLWLIYGILIDSWPVILANGVTLALAGAVLGLKVSHMRRK